MKYKINYFINNKMQTGGGGKKELILFKADWCGHCTKFLPGWQQLQNEMKDVKFTTYECDKDESKVKKYNVDKFPSIFLKTGGNVYEYMSERNLEMIKQFVNSF